MARKLLLGTAESCTGGLTAVLCTNEPGCSRWFAGSVVAYTNSLKSRLLGVEPQTLARFGAVSAQVVEEMAAGALESIGADVTVAISGIAGPGGGTADKPVGTVWFATALHSPGETKAVVKSFAGFFNGDRCDVRFAAALAACEAVEAAISN